MSTDAPYLPPVFPLRGFQGSLADYIDRLHWQYRAMLYESGITLWGRGSCAVRLAQSLGEGPRWSQHRGPSYAVRARHGS